MWYYVYVLKSHKMGCIYIGCTKDLGNRIKQHNNGTVYSTKRMLPIELIYYEAYKSKEHAYQREKRLKYFGSSLGKLKIRLGINTKGRAG